MVDNPIHNKMHESDRIIHLRPIDGKPESTKGIIDSRLFTGENKLHAVMNKETCLWSLKYDSGAVPTPLKQQFTGFGKLLQFVTEYFKRRNIEVIDGS